LNAITVTGRISNLFPSFSARKSEEKIDSFLILRRRISGNVITFQIKRLPVKLRAETGSWKVDVADTI